MKYDVFISYSRKDYIDENKQIIPGNIISQIKELFDANSITYWFDEDGVFSGDAFAPIIARNIKSSSIFLFISSENSNASEWTSNEIATAHAYKKKIIPVRYDDSVYNDSVILYIARLDYIEYKNNPKKALARLLSSVQGYLKEENERVEREKQEEERRRNAEISRQERIAKLNSLRERIENLENRKFELEKDILTQEKSLCDLRNEKRILEANIVELQEEEATLLGYNKTIKEPQIQTKKNNYIMKEWQSFKSALELRHPFVNTINILSFIGLFWLISEYYCMIFKLKEKGLDPISIYALLFIGIAEVLALYQICKNKRSGVVFMLILTLFMWSILFITTCDYWYIENKCTTWSAINKCDFNLYSIVSVTIISILIPFTLFIKKTGVSVWSLMHKKSGKKIFDKSFTIYIIFMLIALGITIYDRCF